AGGVSQEIDPEAVADYFALRYVPGPKTIFKSIRKLPPGCSMTIQAGRAPVIQQYWDVRFEADERVTASTWTDQLHDVTDTAVRLRMIADVPLGAFLSGGVDSGAVVATMARFSNTPVSTFTLGFPEAAFNEMPAARVVAERCRTDHHESIAGPSTVTAI